MSKNKVGVKRRCSWGTLKKPSCLEKMCLLNRLVAIMSSLPLRREWGTDWQVEKQGGKEGKRKSPPCLSSQGGTEGQRVENGYQELGSGKDPWVIGWIKERRPQGRTAVAVHPKYCLYFNTCRQLYRAVYSCSSNSFLYRLFLKGADLTVHSSCQSILNFIAVF